MRINILSEKLAHIVYIALSPKGLSQLLSANGLVLKPAFKQGEIKKNYFYLETFPMRNSTKLKELVAGRAERVTVLIAVNGERLSADLKPEGVDRYIHDKNLNQSDKLYSSKRTIGNASSYLEEISVLVPQGIQIPQEIIDAKKKADGMGVPFYIYANKTDLLSNSRKNAITIPSSVPEERLSDFLKKVRAGKTK